MEIVAGTPTENDHASTATPSGILPTGTEGQLLIAYVIHRISTTITSGPSGWNLISSQVSSGATNTGGVWWRIHQSGDSNPQWTFGAAATGLIQITPYTGFDAADPIIDEQSGTIDSVAATSHTLPTFSTTVDGARAIMPVMHAQASEEDIAAPSPWSDESFNGGGSATSWYSINVFAQDKATAGSVGGESVTTLSTRMAYYPFAIKPSTATIETMRPDTNTGGTATNLNSGTYDFTVLDDDPDSGGTDFLTGTDPSGTAITVRSSTPAIATTQTTTTSTTAVIPNDVVDNDIMIFVVTNGDATAQPTVSDNSGVGSWAVHHNQAGTLVGVSVWWKRVTNQATERGKTVTASGLTGSSCCGITTYIGCVSSGSPFDATAVGEGMLAADLTMAGITTATAGAMVCWAGGWTDDIPALTSVAATDPSSLTIQLNHVSSGGSDSRVALASAIKAAAGATGNITIAGTSDDGAGITFALKPQTPPTTVSTEVRAPMSNPTNTLLTGAGTGQIRAQVRKKGSGSNPTARLEARNAAGTLLATVLSNTSVTSTATAGQVLSGTFDQANITDPTDVVIWVVGTGASGGLVEVGAVEWNAQIEETTPVLLSGELASQGNYAGGQGLEVSRLLSGNLLSTGNFVGALEVSRLLSGTLASDGRYAGQIERTAALSGALASAGTYDSGTLEVTRALTGALSSDGRYAAALEVSRLLSAALASDGRFAGNPSGEVLLDGELASAGNIVGAVEVARLLSGALVSDGRYAGQVEVSRLLSGGQGLASQGAYAGAIEVTRALSAALASQGRYAGEIDTDNPLAFPTTALWPTTDLFPATLDPTVYLSGAIESDGLYAGALQISRLLSGAVETTGDYSGFMEVSRLLSGTLPSNGTYQAALEVSRLLSGALPSDGRYAAQVQVTRALSGALASHGTLAGLLSVTRLLSGALPGTGTYEGSLGKAAILLAGELAARGDYAGVLEVTRLLSAALGSDGRYAGQAEVSKLFSGAVGAQGVYSPDSLAIMRALSGTLASQGLYEGVIQAALLLYDIDEETLRHALESDEWLRRALVIEPELRSP